MESMPPELREGLNSSAGMAAFRAAWPGIVEDFFKWGAAASVTGPTDGSEETGAKDPSSCRE